jgi:hypothetical protein
MDNNEYEEPFRRKATDDENDLLSRESIKNTLQEHFKRTALIRFSQLWGNGKLSKKIFIRAFSGTSKLRESVSGILAAYNNKKVFRITDDEWETPGIDDLYKQIKRLDAIGIETAKNHARQISNKGKINNDKLQ